MTHCTSVLTKRDIEIFVCFPKMSRKYTILFVSNKNFWTFVCFSSYFAERLWSEYQDPPGAHELPGDRHYWIRMGC